MAFIGEKNEGKIYQPGYFLAHDDCVRETRQIAQAGATTTDSGAKYVKMGTVYPANDATAIGIVYEDVDVTVGDMPGSVVTKGVVYEDRLPVALDATAKTALEGKGFTFKTSPTITRPDWNND